MLNKRFFKTKDEVEVTFVVEREDAESALLLCDANEWQPVEMSKRKKDGAYVTKMRFPTNGEVEFRYLLNDTVWVNDEEADAYRPNEFGEENSILFTSQS
ncbi:MAG: isoamylase early set domain-containing protein [Anaerolineae bacterium]|nr:isoamylase early set domain-containing protein [Anaerolineae bacterium]MCO5186866.1 isoamylase early set domain-containing protein [Anaerolineae bacterium]MCO5194463.1 isoamylase early set domain-containing protein [Anaerolineae bacterium]MCO5199925.1 isoamylase early set domain-containing protein [Anaerolineae bacterium]MCO5203701.1 isoamylase early set domain-containing protein [Anaerolineae bacterium]